MSIPFLPVPLSFEISLDVKGESSNLADVEVRWELRVTKSVNESRFPRTIVQRWGRAVSGA